MFEMAWGLIGWPLLIFPAFVLYGIYSYYARKRLKDETDKLVDDYWNNR